MTASCVFAPLNHRKFLPNLILFTAHSPDTLTAADESSRMKWSVGFAHVKILFLFDLRPRVVCVSHRSIYHRYQKRHKTFRLALFLCSATLLRRTPAEGSVATTRPSYHLSQPSFFVWGGRLRFRRGRKIFSCISQTTILRRLNTADN